MKKLREAIFSEKNLYQTEGWRQLLAERKHIRVRSSYQALHQQIKAFAQSRMQGLPIFERITKVFEGTDNWHTLDSLGFIVKFLRAKVSQIEQETSSETLLPEGQSAPALQFKLVVLDYTILYLEFVQLMLKEGLREPEAVSRCGFRQLLREHPKTLSTAHVRLLKYKLKMLDL